MKFKLLDGQDYLNKMECIAIKSVLPDGTVRPHNIPCKNLRECVKKIGFNLGTTYTTDSDILAKLDLT